MRVIFTCGGTAGHVNPALALAGYMKEKDPETAVLFVGTPTGMERELVAKAGYDYAAVEVSSFQRKLNAAGIRHNLHTVRVLASSGRQARAILRQFRPDLVVGTGGYASYPMVKAAAKAGIPTAVHESNMVPGLTTKLLESYADVIMVGFEDCRQHYKHPERIAVTGTPVRGDFFRLSREEARKKLGFDDEAPPCGILLGKPGRQPHERVHGGLLPPGGRRGLSFPPHPRGGQGRLGGHGAEAAGAGTAQVRPAGRAAVHL